MSLNSITNDELIRWHAGQPPLATTVPDISRSGRTDSRKVMAPKGLTDNQVVITLNALVKYIPTEIVTMYVASVSTIQSLRSALPFFDARFLYWGFTVLTPCLLVLMYASKRATEGLPTLPKLREMPWWKMTASSVAFMVWALAVPGNPYIAGDGAPIVAGFGAIVISTLLSLLEPIFDRPLNASPQPSPSTPSPEPDNPPAPPAGGVG